MVSLKSVVLGLSQALGPHGDLLKQCLDSDTVVLGGGGGLAGSESQRWSSAAAAATERRCSRSCVRRRPDRQWEGGRGDRSTDASIPKTFGQMAAHG